MNRALLTSSLVVAGLITSVGCKSEGPPSTPAPTSQPVVMAPSSGNASTPATPAIVTPVVADKDMTHKLTADTPYFTSMPASKDSKPDGMAKAGTKCLVMNPGTTFSQAKMADGSTVYLPTESLDPLGK